MNAIIMLFDDDDDEREHVEEFIFKVLREKENKIYRKKKYVQ